MEKCKYIMSEVMEAVDIANANDLYANKDAISEVLHFIVYTLQTQAKIAQEEMDYEEKLSHNWSDYSVAKGIRDFSIGMLNALGFDN